MGDYPLASNYATAMDHSTSEQDKFLRPAHQDQVAIVGMSLLVPGAHEPGQFWRNLLDKKNLIREIPRERWDWRLYYDADRKSRDKIYSKWGGFLDEVPFEPTEFGIPPASVKSIEPMQLLALETTRRALKDAGIPSGHDHERTSVIFGASGGMADLGQQYATRCELPRMVGEVDPAAYERLPEWTQESFPGLLFNVSAGRVANRFNFGGSNYTVDAACASSLAAVDLGVRELLTGRSDLSLAGGVDTLQSAFAYFCFSKTQALSPTGQARSFDQNADGIVISEGVGILVMKRLADAQRDGDSIYAVIKGIGSSSDGKGSSLTAPTSIGQLRAMRRAYEMAGFGPETIGLYEAHGTGTAAGDRVELNSIVTLLREAGMARHACRIGSLKSLLGHTKSSAGVIGLAKAALALRHRVLPAHAGGDNPLPQLTDPDTPVAMQAEAIPWVAQTNHPRRAAASAFGFGGTNFHVVLEEADTGSAQAGAAHWPLEAFFWSGNDAAHLAESLETTLEILRNAPDCSLAGLARALAERADGRAPVAVVLLAGDRAQLLERIGKAKMRLANGEPPGFWAEAGLWIRTAPLPNHPKIAFLFPGQGSQYVDGLRETSLYLPEFQMALAEAESIIGPVHDRRLSDWWFSTAAANAESRKEAGAALARTEIAQPAIGMMSCALLDFLGRLQVEPDAVAGHSFGEFTALHAAGVLDRASFHRLAALRGEVMAQACQQAAGGMAAVNGERDRITAILGDGPVTVANHNSPKQTVISGPSDALETALTKLEAAGMRATRLPVAGAFHSPLMTEPAQRLAVALAELDWHTSAKATIYSNHDGAPHPDSGQALLARMQNHMLAPVEFVSAIRRMAADGINLFVEVGPRGILTKLANDILTDEPSATLLAFDSGRGALEGTLGTVAHLWAAGAGVSAIRLFDGRACQPVDMELLKQETKPASPKLAHWLLSGGSIRRPTESAGITGQQPPLTAETVGPAQLKKKEQPAEESVSIDKVNTMSIPPSAASGVSGLLSSSPTPGASGQQTALLQAYASYQETMRQFLAVQEEVMRQYLSGAPMPQPPQVASSQPAPMRSAPVTPTPVAAPQQAAPSLPTPPAAAQPEPVPPVAASTGSLNGHALEREGLTQNLLELVSDRTGYPVEALELQADVEADLGIDSIKRVEIFGAFQDFLPPAVGERIAADGESITQLRTLGGWVDAVLERSNGSHG